MGRPLPTVLLAVRLAGAAGAQMPGRFVDVAESVRLFVHEAGRAGAKTHAVETCGAGWAS